MKGKKFVQFAMVLMLVMAMVMAAGCGSGDGKDVARDTPSDKPADATKAPETSADGNEEMPEEGPDTNNGRPYNLIPVKYDNRADKYLYGINATKLQDRMKPSPHQATAGAPW